MRSWIGCLATCVLTAITVAARGDERIIDDFESYAPGHAIAVSAQSRPWQRFGQATNDNLITSKSEGRDMHGKVCARYALAWPNPFGALRRVLDEPLDVRHYGFAAVRMSSDRRESPTTVRLRISDGETTWESTEDQPVPHAARTLWFAIERTKMRRTDGKADYDAVAAKTATIGFTFRSGEEKAAETITLDQVRLTTEKDPQETND